MVATKVEVVTGTLLQRPCLWDPKYRTRAHRTGGAEVPPFLVSMKSRYCAVDA